MLNGSYRLLVVIVNYKSADLVCRSLEKLIPQLDGTVDRVSIVDNNSKDHSRDILSKYIETNNLESLVKLVSSEKNGGFSYGNNVAIREALNNKQSLYQYYLLLNPDTLPCEYAVNELIKFMNEHPYVGIAGSRLEGLDGTVQCSSFRFHTILSELDSGLRFGPISKLLSRWKVTTKIENLAVPTDWLAGASMIIRQEVFDDIGLMDEDYFLYFEETDFCLQAKRKGWQCWYVPSSRVIHFVGQSTGIVSGSQTKARRPQYWFQSRQRFFIKNYGVLYTMLADLVWGMSFAFWRLRRFIQNKPDNDPEKMLYDFWRNSIFFSKIGR
ncbi:hypothetical protein LCGC14_0480300 [marine sediment metagenome]|uniref:Glycosyltransferase 2-like domain-containing protein n=1 Tax=marine sediment metagenome TaxID=412755 RepID=A0A0F9SSP7_9ZZZZ|nr:glycosyltransferase family 2 protein [Methylophaga sp.]HEC58020.1 glycosyltransferase family 2 protein [Methylophaga sp.]